MHHNRNSKGDSLKRMQYHPAATLPQRRFKTGKYVPQPDGVPRYEPGRVTMFKMVRIRADGTPRSKTYSYKGRR